MKKTVDITTDASLSEFVDYIVGELKERLGEEYSVTKKHQLKNNSTRLEGVIIRKEEDLIAPAIYLNTFYDSFKAGQIENPVEQVLRCYYDSCIEAEEQQHILDPCLNNIEENVYFKLINRDRNEEMLNNSPHRIFMDLAVVYYWHMPMSEDTVGSVLITDEIAEEHGYDEKALYRLACTNTPRLFPLEVKSMAEVLLGMLGNKAEKLPEELASVESYPMYVVSNSRLTNGATALIYPEFRTELNKIFPEGYYILPSSIHELIAVPPENDENSLLGMVANVNRTEVPQTDYLSDNVYKYLPEEDRFKIVINDAA